MDSPTTEAERDRLGVPRHSIIKDAGLASVALNEEERRQPNHALGQKLPLVALALKKRNIDWLNPLFPLRQKNRADVLRAASRSSSL